MFTIPISAYLGIRFSACSVKRSGPRVENEFNMALSSQKLAERVERKLRPLYGEKRTVYPDVCFYSPCKNF